MTEFTQSEELDSRITDLVEQHWQEHQTPLLLSLLGSQDGGEIARRVKAHHTGLRAYLRHRLEDRVQVIQHSTNPTITGVVPASATLGTDEEINASLEKTQHGSSEPVLRFHPAFWAAFRKPLGESNRRYMSVATPIRFQDSSGENQSNGFVEVPRTYISDSAMDDDQTLQNAERWLADNELQKNIYLTNAKPDPDFDHPRNLLDRLLLSLEPKELNRISMPLDIILKLRNQAP